MNFHDIADKISAELLEVAMGAGLVMIGVASIVWIIGKRAEALQHVKAIFQGIALAILGPICFMWFYKGLISIKTATAGVLLWLL